MNKSKQKNEIQWNTEAIKSLASRYGFTKHYIKQCITGDRTPLFADQLKQEYKDLCQQLETILNNNKL
jgi:hypothetical protein